MADYLAAHLTQDTEYHVICMGCSPECVPTGVSLIHDLTKKGYRFRTCTVLDTSTRRDVNLDVIAGLQAIGASADAPLSIIARSWSELLKIVLDYEKERARCGVTLFPVLVFGLSESYGPTDCEILEPNAFDTMSEFYDMHSMLCYCADLSRKGRTVIPEFLRLFIKDDKGDPLVHKTNWWDLACRLITSESAKQHGLRPTPG